MTHRNFGIMSGRTISGGFDNRPSATRSSYAPRDSYSLPPLPPGSILKVPEITEPPVHKFQPFERALLGFLAALALVCAFFLLFVET